MLVLTQINASKYILCVEYIMLCYCIDKWGAS